MAKAAGKIEGNPEKKSQLELQNATISSRVSHFFFFFSPHTYTRSSWRVLKIENFFYIYFFFEQRIEFASPCAATEEVYKIHFNNVECSISGTAQPKHTPRFHHKKLKLKQKIHV